MIILTLEGWSSSPRSIRVLYRRDKIKNSSQRRNQQQSPNGSCRACSLGVLSAPRLKRETMVLKMQQIRLDPVLLNKTWWIWMIVCLATSVAGSSQRRLPNGTYRTVNLNIRLNSWNRCLVSVSLIIVQLMVEEEVDFENDLFINNEQCNDSQY